jgi:hypothetical protein
MVLALRVGGEVGIIVGKFISVIFLSMTGGRTMVGPVVMLMVFVLFLTL